MTQIRGELRCSALDRACKSPIFWPNWWVGGLRNSGLDRADSGEPLRGALWCCSGSAAQSKGWGSGHHGRCYYGTQLGSLPPLKYSAGNLEACPPAFHSSLLNHQPKLRGLVALVLTPLQRYPERMFPNHLLSVDCVSACNILKILFHLVATTPLYLIITIIVITRILGLNQAVHQQYATPRLNCKLLASHFVYNSN